MYDREGEDKIRDLNLDTRRIHPYSMDEFGLVWLDSDSGLIQYRDGRKLLLSKGVVL